MTSIRADIAQPSTPLSLAIAATALLLVSLLHAGKASAHGSLAAVAWPTNPDGVGEIADASYTFAWVDSDQLTSTGTATIDWFYTATNPPTFPAGGIPAGLEGTPIVLGIPESDTANQYTWDTRGVAPGSYWIWSIVNEPPGERGSIQIVAFSPGVVTIAHPGDDISPAVVIKRPDSPYRWADESYVVEYAAFDPDRSGRVRLEAARASHEDELILLADDLHTSTTTFHWNTSALPEGDWLLRATLTDARGRTFSAYGRFFLLVVHATLPDAGVPPADGAVDGGEPDAGPALEDGAPGNGSKGEGPRTRDERGCGCSASRSQGDVDGWPHVSMVLLSALVSRRRDSAAMSRRSGGVSARRAP